MDICTHVESLLTPRDNILFLYDKDYKDTLDGDRNSTY